ncbi:nucleotidyltransferase domain-containing protein [Salipaludibacillus daqingensis]|uniref:nucleotidyltransferase domain-containing protein n=1 Tax=Salipaludibacillus daqingensis TaxID=3041001 RepID=UPI0024770A59|nr:nucleotidyltransferase domain-containing protein [Salipaludibacillus daqingensis]
MGIPKPICHQIINISQQFPDIKEVRLFGSRAYGDHQPRSDIDLAIIAPEISDYDWRLFSEKIEEDIETLLKIDLIRWDKASSKLREEIGHHNIVLYLQEPKRSQQ